MSVRPHLPEPPLENGSLSRQLTGLRSPIIWGILLLIAIEGTLLGLFITSYFYLRLSADIWPPAPVGLPDLLVPSLGQGLILLSVVPIWWGLRGLPKGRTRPLLWGLPVAIGLAGGALLLKVWEYAGRDYLWSSHTYGSLDWTMTGYSAMHVVAAVLAGAVVWVLGLRGHFHAGRYTGVQALAFYWVFVAAGSFAFYVTQYLSPYG